MPWLPLAQHSSSSSAAAAGDAHTIGEQNAVDAVVDGFGLGKLQGILGSAAGQAAEMDGMYAGMLRRLEKLAREVEKSNLLVLKQEIRKVLHESRHGICIIVWKKKAHGTEDENGGTSCGKLVWKGRLALCCAMCRGSVLLLRVHAALLLLAALPALIAGQPWQICGENGNYTANSTYQANLKQLAAALHKNVSSGGRLFASGAVGAVPDAVYALALCRGDINASACADCVGTIFQDAQQLCPYGKEVSIVYDSCYLRFSNLDFLSSADNSGVVDLYNTGTVSGDVGRYDRAVTGLLNATARYAAGNANASSSSRLFATGVMVGFDAQFPKIYAMAQCSPDLSPAQCGLCLGAMVARWWQTFEPNTQGARSVGARCNMRVELYSFYNVPSMLQLQAEAVAPSPSPAPAGKPPAVPGTTGAASRSEDFESIESLILDLSTLRIATDNFSENNKLGEGGFGVVYKGSLPHGEEIAVKRLSQSSVQGIGELKNELVLVAKLQHKNLVRLVGVCLEEHERMLVYEYMPNRSLDTILFDAEKSSLLDWGKRLKIINGVARGMQYLHEDSQLKIVHRDLKASNVLLDSDYNPKISDFGLARLFGGDQTQDVTNRVVGTYGYMAPEYAMRGHYSVKSDVFSFGVLVLEIVTGRRNSGSYYSEQSGDLLSIIWEHWTMGTIMEMVDRSMGERAAGGEIARCIHVGLLCVQENPASRPAMSAVNVMLSSGTVSLKAPSRPAFYIRKGGGDGDGGGGTGSYSGSFVGTLPSSGRSAPMSPNEVSITELEPR
uniref:Uncharacterized protein n=1 Tax=Oryza barthii TaxID=65489 RepID=A0A0D3GS16_9ORYZ